METYESSFIDMNIKWTRIKGFYSTMYALRQDGYNAARTDVRSEKVRKISEVQILQTYHVGLEPSSSLIGLTLGPLYTVVPEQNRPCSDCSVR